MVLGMVRDGLFSEITHGEAAYLHDAAFDCKRRRRPVAPVPAHGLWQSVPDARTGPRGPLHGHHRGDRFDYGFSKIRLRHLSTYVKANFADGTPSAENTFAAI